MQVNKIVLFFTLLLGFSVTTQLFAEEDSVTFATYYPAPYGYYNEMQVQKMAVGKVDTTLVPVENGQLLVDRSVIFSPQADLKAIEDLPNPQIGELAYAASEDKFYYNNQGTSSSWVAQSASGGGVCYTNYGQSDCESGYTAVIQGYTAMYLAQWSGVMAAGELICSSVSHAATGSSGISVLGSSANGMVTTLANEPCAICCK